jgi:hypothetical protein
MIAHSALSFALPCLQDTDHYVVMQYTHEHHVFSVFHEHPLPWRFIDRHGRRQVQVSRFPPLDCSRTAPDWGWAMTNG